MDAGAQIGLGFGAVLLTGMWTYVTVTTRNAKKEFLKAGNGNKQWIQEWTSVYIDSNDQKIVFMERKKDTLRVGINEITDIEIKKDKKHANYSIIFFIEAATNSTRRHIESWRHRDEAYDVAREISAELRRAGNNIQVRNYHGK